MYIVKINTKAFACIEIDKSTIIVSDPNKATKFDNIGDAMRGAIQVNTDFEETIARVCIFNTSVSREP